MTKKTIIIGIMLLLCISGSYAALTDSYAVGFGLNQNGNNFVLGKNNLTNTSIAPFSTVIYKLGNASLGNLAGSGSNTINGTMSSWLTSGNHDHSFDVWINGTSIDGTQRIIYEYAWSGTTDGGLQLMFMNPTTIRIDQYGDAKDFTLPVFKNNTWYHIAGVYINTTHTWNMYVNGTNIQNLTTTSNANLLSSGQLELGGQVAAAAFWKGHIDNLNFWDRALTASEVSQLYAGNNGTEYPFNTSPAAPILTIQANNIVNNTIISNFCMSATGTNTTQNNCTNSSSLNFNTTGIYNISLYSIGNGDGVNQKYFNQTYNNYNFSTTTTLIINTYQSIINITTQQLYTNFSISNFNITNNKVSNSTSGSQMFIVANIGQNNISFNASGNYSFNTSCNAVVLSTSNCILSGVYDSVFNLTAKNSSSGNLVTNFSVIINSSITNQTLNTTSTNISIPLLQGYSYSFIANATGLSLANATLPSNQSQFNYTFNLLLQNTFFLYFYNETTGNLLNNINVTFQLVGTNFANNYSTSNGTLSIFLLTPDIYTMTYWYDPSVPRNYFTTLTPQSYQNLSLFIIDAAISQLYLPVIKDQNSQALANAYVSLLRYYIDPSTQTGVYKIVEMALSDTNGQAVLRVVPNTINYKLLISKGNYSVITTPTKLTSSTNTYTLSSQDNPLNTVVGLQNLQYSLQFINATNTFSFTWYDTTNTVTSACLTVTKYDYKSNGAVTTTQSCGTNGVTGLIYTITDTNNTRYVAEATVITTSTTISLDTTSIDYRTSTSSLFGIVGILITLMLLVTVGIIANESGADGLLVVSILGLFASGVFGFIAYDWKAFIGVAIFGIIILYKIRR